MAPAIQVHKPITIAIGFEDHPDCKPEPIDLFELYSVAVELHAASPQSWLKDWSQWISTMHGWPQLTETEANSLWEQVASLRDKVIHECHERAAFALKGMTLPRPITDWLGPSLS